MASHGFVGFDPDQTQAVITATVSLHRTIEDAIAAAIDQFKNALVTSDAVLGECEYKDEVGVGLVNNLEKIGEDLELGKTFESFNKKVSEAEAAIGAAFNKNTANNNEAQAELRSQAKKAGAVLQQ